jgi:hypothetical protein
MKSIKRAFGSKISFFSGLFLSFFVVSLCLLITSCTPSVAPAAEPETATTLDSIYVPVDCICLVYLDSVPIGGNTVPRGFKSKLDSYAPLGENASLPSGRLPVDLNFKHPIGGGGGLERRVLYAPGIGGQGGVPPRSYAQQGSVFVPEQKVRV